MTGWSTIDYGISDWLAFQLPRQEAFVKIFYVPALHIARCRLQINKEPENVAKCLFSGLLEA